jgi:hypothetical protein
MGNELQPADEAEFEAEVMAELAEQELAAAAHEMETEGVYYD